MQIKYRRFALLAMLPVTKIKFVDFKCLDVGYENTDYYTRDSCKVVIVVCSETEEYPVFDDAEINLS